LAHLFGLKHLRYPATNPPACPCDDSYPHPNGQLSGGAGGEFVGFDTGDTLIYGLGVLAFPGGSSVIPLGRPGTPLPAKPLSGIDWHDVMTYCPRQWISDVTYNKIRCQLEREDGVQDASCPGPGAFQPVAEPRISSAAYVPRLVSHVVSRTAEDRAAGTELALVESGDFVSVIAFVSPEKNKSKIHFVRRLAKAQVSPDVQNSLYRVRLVASDGTKIDRGVAVKLNTEVEQKKDDPEGLVQAIVLIPDGFVLSKVILLRVKEVQEEEVASHTIGTTSPKFEGSLLPSSQLYSYGRPDENSRFVHRVGNGLQEAEQTLGSPIWLPVAAQALPYTHTWGVVDSADKSKLTYTVQISTDGGTTWRTLAVGWRQEKLTITETHLEGMQVGAGGVLKIKVRVIASDGFNAASKDDDVTIIRSSR